MTPVLIGGSGRSGTSILKQILSAHPCTVSIASELRIIIDPGGGLDLFSALTDRWSPYSADRALLRFRRLLEDCASENPFQKAFRLMVTAVGASPRRYGHCAIGSQFGDSFYRQRLERLFGQLIRDRSAGYWIGSPSYRMNPVIQEAGPLDSETAGEIIGSFFHDLYRHRAGSDKVTHWLDDTPFNILHALGLLALFPDMRLLHIHRNPLDVVASYRTKAWGGQETETIARRLSHVFQKWLAVRDQLPAPMYMEIGLEPLLDNPKKVLAELCGFAGLETDQAIIEAAENVVREDAHLGRWKSDLSPQEADKCRELFHPIMTAYGYV